MRTGIPRLDREMADASSQFVESSSPAPRSHSRRIAGAATVVGGTVLLCLMLAHFLWGVPGQPLALSDAAVGIPALGIDIALIVAGMQHMKTIDSSWTHSTRSSQDEGRPDEHAGDSLKSACPSSYQTIEEVRGAFDTRDQFDERPLALVASVVSLAPVDVLPNDGAAISNNASGSAASI